MRTAEFTGPGIMAGVDEVGRGPLAGPVTAAAVILPPDFPIHLLADSKTLPAARREAVSREILRHAQVGIASVPADVIDRTNIRVATLLAMTRAIGALPVVPHLALIDGRDVPPDLPCPARAIIQGDARVAAIAAASIVAKVARDRLMAVAAEMHPGYGFERHAGYPTAAHRSAIRSIGLSPIHRRSFAPCRAAMSGNDAPA